MFPTCFFFFLFSYKCICWGSQVAWSVVSQVLDLAACLPMMLFNMICMILISYKLLMGSGGLREMKHLIPKIITLS